MRWWRSELKVSWKDSRELRVEQQCDVVDPIGSILHWFDKLYNKSTTNPQRIEPVEFDPYKANVTARSVTAHVSLKT